MITFFLLVTGCAQRRLQYLHGVTENRHTLKILSKPAPMKIFLDDEFLGITPLTAELWFREKEKLVLSAKGVGEDTTFHTMDLRYGAIPKSITFYSRSGSAGNRVPAGEALSVRGTSGITEIVRSPSPSGLLSCNMPVIYFKFDDSQLSSPGKEKLNTVKALLETDPAYHLEIHGYADEQGSEVYNRQLSLNRAKSVYKHLVALGLKKSRLSVYGHGEITTLQYDGFELEYAESRVVRFRLFIPDLNAIP